MLGFKSFEEIVIAYKDRLARFEFDFFAWLCSKNYCEIVVLNQVELSPLRNRVSAAIVSSINDFSGETRFLCVHYPLSTIHCQLSTVNYPLSTVHCPLSTVHYFNYPIAKQDDSKRKFKLTNC